MSAEVRMVRDDERIALDTLFAEAWGPPITTAQFLDRQKHLQALPWIKDREVPWSLYSEKGEMLSSCEITEVKSSWKGNAGRCFGVASVFTAEALRKKGHAETLLRGVLDQLKRRYADIHGFYLYSEVGPTLYGRLGFVEVLPRERVFTPANFSGAAETISENAWPNSVARLRPSGDFVITPERDQLEWHLTREKLYGRYLNRELPSVRGAKAGDSFTLWMADYRYESLRALVFQSGNPVEAEALVQAGRAMAKRIGLDDFRVWEGDSFTGWNELREKGTSVFLDDSLPMFRPEAPGLNAFDLKYLPRAMWV